MVNSPFDPEAETEPASWEDMRERVVQNSVMLPDSASPEAKRAELHSQSMMLLRAFFDEGIRVAKERGLRPMTPTAWRLIEPLTEIAKDIAFSHTLVRLPIYMEERAELTPAQVHQIFRITHPTPSRELVAEARKGQRVQCDIAGFHEAVSRYLESEFRIPYADRVLLAATFDTEITAYLREIYEKDFFSRQSVAAAMDRAPIVTWLIGRGWSVLRLLIVTAAAIAASRIGWVSDVTAFWIFFVALGLMAVGTVISFFGYLSFRQ